MSSPDKKPLMLWACLVPLVLILALLVALYRQGEELRTLQAQAEETDRAIAGLRQQIAQAKAVAAPALAQDAAATAKKQTLAQDHRYISDLDARKDPRFAAIILRNERRGILANYKAAITALKLPPQVEARLRELIIERENSENDALAILERSGQSQEGLREKLWDEIRREFSQSLSQLLGAETAGQFEYLRKQETQQRSNEVLYTDLWDAGFPLTEAQQSSLTRAQLEISARFEASKSSSNDSAASTRGAEGQALLQVAASFLNPEQLRFIETQQREEARRRTLSASRKSRPNP